MFFAFRIWNIALVFFLSLGIFPNISIHKGSFENFLVAIGLYTAIIIALPWIIQFFKLNVNYASFFLFGAILSFVYFYLMANFFMGILDVDELDPHQKIAGISFLSGFSWQIMQVVVIAGLSSIILQTINQVLMDRI